MIIHLYVSPTAHAGSSHSGTPLEIQEAINRLRSWGEGHLYSLQRERCHVAPKLARLDLHEAGIHPAANELVGGRYALVGGIYTRLRGTQETYVDRRQYLAVREADRKMYAEMQADGFWRRRRLPNGRHTPPQIARQRDWEIAAGAEVR